MSRLDFNKRTAAHDFDGCLVMPSPEIPEILRRGVKCRACGKTHESTIDPKKILEGGSILNICLSHGTIMPGEVRLYDWLFPRIKAGGLTKLEFFRLGLLNAFQKLGSYDCAIDWITQTMVARPGAKELLTALDEAGVQNVIISNNVDETLRRLIAHYFGDTLSKDTALFSNRLVGDYSSPFSLDILGYEQPGFDGRNGVPKDWAAKQFGENLVLVSGDEGGFGDGPMAKVAIGLPNAHVLCTGFQDELGLHTFMVEHCNELGHGHDRVHFATDFREFMPALTKAGILA